MPVVRLTILLVTYALIAAVGLPRLRLNRPGAALLGAVAMVTLGGLPLRDAYAAIDLDVIVFLLGMLLVTAYLELAGAFEWAAVRVVRHARSPRLLLAVVVAMSGVLSAFFINDTVCLVLPPLLIAMLRPLGLRARPYLLAIAMASNVGSAMAITGNPQNMLIGVSSGISFARFLQLMAPASLGGLSIVYAAILVLCRRDLEAREPRADDELAPPFDRGLAIATMAVFAAALAGWLAGYALPVVAIAAGGAMLVVARRDPARAMEKVEWPLLLFFGALFVVMRGARDLAVVTALTGSAVGRLTTAPWHDATVISAAMLALSNLVSNVPAVILWLPAVRNLPHAEFVWLTMAMSSTFAGNLTLLGSMANLIVAERAKSRGVSLGFVEYMRVGIPVTLLTLAWGIATLVWFAA